MAGAKITETLGSAGYFALNKAEAFSMRVVNSGDQPLTAFKVKFYVSSDDPGENIFDTDAEFSAPASGSVIQHTEQRDSSGARTAIAPTTLPAGSNFFFVVATNTAYVKTLHAVEILAQVASGQSTTLNVHLGGN